MRRTLLTGIAALALVVAGCSSDGPETDASATSSTTSPTTSEQSDAATTSKMPTGRALYAEVCAGSKEFFAGTQELAEMMGEPWDQNKAADEFMDLIEHPENYPELQEMAAASGSPTDNEEWDQLSKSDQEQIRKAIYAAAKGEC